MVKPQAGGKRERRDRVNSGRFKGVRMRKWGKWVAEVRQPNSRDRIWLGSYDTSEEAARAYDAAVFCLRGPTAVMNFPDDPPDILSAGELSPPQIQVAASRHARRVLAESTTSGSGAVALELKPPVVESTLFGESEYMGSSSFVDFSSTDCYLAAEEGGGPGGGGGGDGSGNERALSTHAYFGTQSKREMSFDCSGTYWGFILLGLISEDFGPPTEVRPKSHLLSGGNHMIKHSAWLRMSGGFRNR
ncbi:AP2/ERF transcription factor [Abeliophyllum distichum]|uniref:AP2/ERF transcription factor n=1 Tax=Abeliophyllum distichum TaxID=126358 RepID=A0ABD1VAN7_9LAMI